MTVPLFVSSALPCGARLLRSVPADGRQRGARQVTRGKIVSMTARKITITIPGAVLDEAERTLARPGESRSALLSRLLADAITANLEQQYADGYRRIPVTPEEDSAMEAAAREGVADVKAGERARGREWHRRAAR